MRPNRPESLTFLAGALIAAGLCLAGCTGDEQVAGTSTSVGTSIGGRALLADGRPAAGAAIRVRSRQLGSADGHPAAMVLDSTLADLEGRFSLSRPPEDSFYLDIQAPLPESFAPLSLAASRQALLRPFPRAPEAGLLGDLRLEETGALAGEVREFQDPGGAVIWVGILGSGRFTRAEAPAVEGRIPFRLADAPAGAQTLMVLYWPKSSPAKIPPSEVRITVTSGEETSLGLVK